MAVGFLSVLVIGGIVILWTRQEPHEGLRRGEEQAEAEIGRALVSLEEERGVARNSYRIYLKPGDIAIVTLGLFRAEEAVNLIEGMPVTLPPDVELLAMRVNELGVTGGGVVTYPGLLCTRRWPPRGYGPTRSIAASSLRKNDQFAVSAWLRLDRPGDVTVDGLEMLYEIDEGVYSQTFGHTSLRMSVTGNGESAQGVLCDPRAARMWDKPFAETR